MTDRIFIHGIECYGFHGVTGAERKVGNRFQIDVVVELDTAQAALSDSIADTVDYRAIHGAVLEWVEKRSFRLLEAMAEGLAAHLLTLARVHAVELRIRKLGPRLSGIVGSVGIEIRRSQPEAYR